jgi:hypothetical protein
MGGSVGISGEFQPAAAGDRRWFLGGVLLTCMCGLMLQIMETRIFSVIAYYHLAFLAIGIAMLGMTAGAIAVFYRARAAYQPAELLDLLAKIMAAFAWTLLASLVTLLSLAIGAAAAGTLSLAAGWLLAFAVLLPPYVLLGAAVSLALTRSAQPISLVYGFDLIGASVGCLVTLAILTVTDSYTAVLLVGAIGAAAGLAFRRAMPKVARKHVANPLLNPGITLAVLLAIAGINGLLGPRGLRPVVVKGVLEQASQLTEERWNAFSRISLTMRPPSEDFMWSPSAIAPHATLDQGWLNIDGFAGSPIYHFNGDFRTIDFLKYDATSFAYYIRHSGRSAVIGIGGGRDLLTASLFGFKDITAVEYNPILVALFSRDYRNFSGVGSLPGLRFFVDDARSWFARSHQQFDLIQMSQVDTFAATGAGAFTLSENGLYTVEGWKRFMARLTPTGVFTVSRWYSPDQEVQTGRLVSMAMATLIEQGAAHPRDHIYLIGNGALSTLILGRSALTASDISTLNQTADRLKYRVIAEPGRPAADPTLERMLAAKSTQELENIGAGAALILTPPRDDSPFFFNQLKIWDPSSLARAFRSHAAILDGNLAATLTLFDLVVVSLLALWAVVIYPTRDVLRVADRKALVWCSAWFLAIGLGFMFVEMSLIQRMSLFLGHPTYGLAIVLFSIILATGVGSLVSERAMPLTARSVVGWPLLLAAYVATLPFWLGSVISLAEPGNLLVRASVCLGVVVPCGVLMGFMFPTGLRLCGRVDPRLAPWLWAVNGAAGVLASSAAVLVSIQTSLSVSLWVGAAAYAALSVVALQVLGLHRDHVHAESAAAPA